MKCNCTPFSYAQRSTTWLTNSGPLSMMMHCGLRPCCFSFSSTRTTRGPGREVSTSISKASRLNPSIRFSVRNRRPLASASWMKSMVHTWSGAVAGAAVSCARRLAGGVPVCGASPAFPRHTTGTPACDSPASLLSPVAPATSGSRICVAPRPTRAAATVADDRPLAASGNDTSHDPSLSARRRVAGSFALPLASPAPPPAASAGSPLFCQHRLQRPIVQGQFRYHVLQLPVLILQLLQSPGLAQLQSAILRLPAVKAGTCDPVPPAQLSGFHSRLRFLQDGDDLFFVESTLPHGSSSGPGGPS